jgi:TIR domain
MAHDVFISHAHKDKGIANAICAKLESAQVRCWIADRDIAVGEDWTEVTRNAIESSRLMVLVLSENANVAPHIEREIAHAFYTGRTIMPLRVTNTLPRRDFLFYLGNIRCFDAFNPPAEQHLEAFTESIHGMMRGSTATADPVPPRQAIKRTVPIHSSNSWIGALQASHYQTLERLKRGAIAGSLLAIGLLFYFAPWQTKQEVLPASEETQARYSRPDPAPDLPPPPAGTASAAKSAYVYSRFGLWVAPNTGPKTSDLPEPQKPLSTSTVLQAANAPPSPGLSLDRDEATDTERVDDGESSSATSVQEDPHRRTNRHEMHRRKTRTKRHPRRASEESLVGRIEGRLKSVWRHVVAGRE